MLKEHEDAALKAKQRDRVETQALIDRQLKSRLRLRIETKSIHMRWTSDLDALDKEIQTYWENDIKVEEHRSWSRLRAKPQLSI